MGYSDRDGFLDRKQVGLRFQPGLWMDYRRLCASERIHPNDLLERTMQVAVEAGSVKAGIARVSVASEGQRVADEAQARRLLRELEVDVDVTVGIGEISDIQEKIDRLCELLPRVRDERFLAQAKRMLEMADRYLMGIPRGGGGILTDEEADEKRKAMQMKDEAQDSTPVSEPATKSC